jgi:hypothetical protein
MAHYLGTCEVTNHGRPPQTARLRIQAASIEEAHTRIEQYAQTRVYRRFPGAVFSEWTLEPSPTAPLRPPRLIGKDPLAYDASRDADPPRYVPADRETAQEN